MTVTTLGDLVGHATLIATRGPSSTSAQGAVMRWCWYCHQIMNIRCGGHRNRPEWMPDRPGEPYWAWEQEAAAVAQHLAACPAFAEWLADGRPLKEELDW